MKAERPVIAVLLMLLSAAALAQPKEARTAAVTPKLSPPVAIAGHYDGEPVVGQPLAVTLTINTGIAARDAGLTVRAGPALELIEPLGTVALGALEPDVPVTVEAVVLPLAGGTSYLRVALTAIIDGRRQSAGLSLPLRLPEAAVPAGEADEPEGAGKTDASVRSLPAVEEIR